MIVAIFKSNYRENLENYKEIKGHTGENMQICGRMFLMLGLLSVTQGCYLLFLIWNYRIYSIYFGIDIFLYLL